MIYIIDIYTIYTTQIYRIIDSRVIDSRQGLWSLKLYVRTVSEYKMYLEMSASKTSVNTVLKGSTRVVTDGIDPKALWWVFIEGEPIILNSLNPFLVG